MPAKSIPGTIGQDRTMGDWSATANASLKFTVEYSTSTTNSGWSESPTVGKSPSSRVTNSRWNSPSDLSSLKARNMDISSLVEVCSQGH